jgi:hypothetical protein
VPAIEMPAPLKSEPRRERFDDLKEAYALGALSEEERQEVEDYLMRHPELRAEVNGHKVRRKPQVVCLWGCDPGSTPLRILSVRFGY